MGPARGSPARLEGELGPKYQRRGQCAPERGIVGDIGGGPRGGARHLSPTCAQMPRKEEPVARSEAAGVLFVDNITYLPGI